MTETKMIKILTSLANKKGNEFAVFNMIDIWADKQPIRETITIEMLINEFSNKSGKFYMLYHIPENFRNLQKQIEIGHTAKLKWYYKDSHESYMSKWKEEHPNEDYETWVKQERIKKNKEFGDYINSVTRGFFGHYSFPMILR